LALQTTTAAATIQAPATNDFKANLVIVNLSPATKNMQAELPSNYTSSQNSGEFAYLYGSGYEIDKLKQTLLQLEANNYLYSPNTQSQTLKVDGAGKYLIQFEIPFVTAPLNVSVVGSSFTDVFIEFTDNFGMIVNVLTDAMDILNWTASGFVGAATQQWLGDALYNNFGALYGFPRLGDSQIDDTFVRQYESVNLFINVEQIISSINTPPIGITYYTGFITPTLVTSTPQATHQLTDSAGNILALLNASSATTTPTQPVSAFYPSSANISSSKVYIVGAASTFTFDRWQQANYIQEVFRADNKYRRILSGINRSLAAGPTLNGLSNLVEALLAQPYIPYNIWDESDFRLFKNSENQSTPKYFTANGYATQYEAYPSPAPVVEIKRVTTNWNPTNLTYANQPAFESIYTSSSEPNISQTITALNQSTRFDISNELVRQLRLGLDTSEGGVITWNYANNEVLNSLPASGFALYEKYSYVFLNNVGDSFAGLNLFYYAIKSDNSAYTCDALQYGQDYLVINTSNFYVATSGAYNLPSELLQRYNVDSTIPFLNTNITWAGSTSNQPGLLSLPQFVIQLKLSAKNINRYGIIGQAPNFPYNVNNFIVYSYSNITVNPTSIDGNLTVDPQNPYLVAYYDSDTAQALQPTDSPFFKGTGQLTTTALAQSSFAKFESSTGYQYIIAMIGGQIQFNKTVFISDILNNTAVNNNTLSAPVILHLQALQISSVSSYASFLAANNLSYAEPYYVPMGITQYSVMGKIVSILENNQRRIQISGSDYALVDVNDNLLALIDNGSPIYTQVQNAVGQTLVITGTVLETIWDTRIPVTNYRFAPPVFQAAANFDSVITPFTPDLSVSISKNNNFLIIIQGLPLGNQQSVTASWSFSIQPTSQNPQNATTNTEGQLTIGFPDIYGSGNLIQYGIMTLFTGKNLLQYISGSYIDADNALYNQTYTSPSLSVQFLNYFDYINDLNPGSKLNPLGDIGVINTLTTPYVPPNIAQPIVGDPIASNPNINSVLNFFHASYGFVSFSILPGMLFFEYGSGASVDITRPNNNGLAITIINDTAAGLVFYGKNTDKVVDKPTRLIVDYTYTLANLVNRKKIVEIEDGSFASWVSATQPNIVMEESTFYISGSQFKYPHSSLDQASNQYNDVYSGNTVISSGNTTGQNPVAGNFYSIDSSMPIFEVDPTVNSTHSLNIIGEAGPPFRYRNVATPTELANYTYINNSAEKIAFLQFDLSEFPYDTIVNQAILEIYFASGFTIKEAKNTSFVLNDNKAWQKSRLSGNGITAVNPVTNIIKPQNNVHWRQNYFEVLVPYVFLSEPNDLNYGISNLFSPQTVLPPGQAPKPVNPQPNLEYLGFINLDEIDIESLTTNIRTNLQENSVGLANVILTQSSIIFTVDGILTFNQPGSAVGIDVVQSDSQSYLTLQNSQSNLLINDKILVFPYGLGSNLFFYGYIKSIIPSSFIGFTDLDISIYQQVFDYAIPIYSQYVVKLLEADTYFPYTSFGRETALSNTPQDISF